MKPITNRALPNRSAKSNQAVQSDIQQMKWHNLRDPTNQNSIATGKMYQENYVVKRNDAKSKKALATSSS